MVPELRARGIGETLDVAVSLYRARFKRVLLLAAIVMVPVQVLSVVVLLSAQPDRVGVSAFGSVTAQSNGNTTFLQLAASLTIVLIDLIADAFVIGLCARTLADAYIGAVAPSNRAGAGNFFSILGASTLVALSALGGLALCGVGAFFVIAFLAVAMPVVVLEGASAGRAYGRSCRLTVSNYFRVLGLVVSAWFLGWVLGFGLEAGTGLLLRNSGSPTAQVIAASISAAVAATITSPFIAAAAVSVYFDCRIRDEAFDVQLLMQRNDARYADAAPAA